MQCIEIVAKPKIDAIMETQCMSSVISSCQGKAFSVTVCVVSFSLFL